MSDKLAELVVLSVGNSSAYANRTDAEKFRAEKQLEKEIEEEIVREHVDDIESKLKRNEKTREEQKRLKEFRDLLIQCVALAFLVSLFAAHVYGLLDAKFYETEAGFAFDRASVAAAVMFVLCVIVLFYEYVHRLVGFVKAWRNTENGVDEER